MRTFLTGIGIFILAGTALPGLQISRADEPVTIVFLTWKPSQPEVWERLIEQFQSENPRIHVKIQVGPHSSTNYHAIVAQRLKNRDDSMDVFFLDVIWPPEFANAGWALDLTSRFPPTEQEKFLPGTIAANTWQGKIYGIPCFLGAGIFYYRKDLLKKYHLPLPRTWNEMLSTGKAVIEREKVPGLYAYSAQFKQYEGLVCNMMEFLWSNGGAVINRKTGQVVLKEPSALEAVAFVRDRIIGKAAPQGAVNYEEPESLSLFIEGKAVFHRNWPYAWALANDPEKSKIAGKIGVGALPTFQGHHSASALGGWQFGINRYSRHSKEAWKFIQFMTSPQSQKTLALQAGLAPTRKAIYRDRDIQEKMPHLKTFLPAFEKAKPRPLSPVYPMISQELQRYFSRGIVEQNSDLPEMAGEIAARIEKLLRLAAMVGK